MSDLKQKLLNMKDKIDQAKAQADKLTGALDQMTAQLKDRFGVDLDGATALTEQLEGEIAELEKDISDQVKKLEDEYDWS